MFTAVVHTYSQFNAHRATQLQRHAKRAPLVGPVIRCKWAGCQQVTVVVIVSRRSKLLHTFWHLGVTKKTALLGKKNTKKIGGCQFLLRRFLVKQKQD